MKKVDPALLGFRFVFCLLLSFFAYLFPNTVRQFKNGCNRAIFSKTIIEVTSDQYINRFLVFLHLYSPTTLGSWL